MSSASWTGYDEVAATYRAVVEPRFFAAPAAHLVSLLGVGRDSVVLDAGTGTGAVASAALARGAAVFSLDLSLPMLLAGPATVKRSAACLPDLPFRAAVFSQLTAGFVLSHLPEPTAFLGEAARVLRPGGAIGVTSWARDASEAEAGQVWYAAISEVVPMDQVMAAIGPVLPNEQALSSVDGLAAVFDGTPFVVRHAGTGSFRTELTAAEYVRSRTAGSTSRYLRSALEPARWEELQREAVRRIEARLGARFEIATDVNFVAAISMK